MTPKELREYISKNDKLPEILESLGMHSISGVNPRYYSAGMPDGDNPVSTIIYKDESLTVNAYTRKIEVEEGRTPNIFNLIMFINKCEFSTAISWCHAILKLENSRSSQTTVRSGLLDFFKTKGRNRDHRLQEKEQVYYDLDILNGYSKTPHIDLIRNDFLIDQRVLDKYMVMFDDRSDRIIFPHLKYNDASKVAGVVGRTVHKAWKELKINKYMSMLPTRYDKTYNLYGLCQNIEEIKRQGKVFIFEAEKSVMKLDMYGLPLGVSVGCHNISEFQLKLLRGLDVDIYVCFDKDVELDHIKSVCRKLTGRIGSRTVYYIYDSEDVLDVKDSPVDKGIRVWNKLLEQRIKYEVEREEEYV